MDRGTAVVLTAAVGGALALQAPINSTLGRSVGNVQGAFVSFLVGTLVLAVIVALSRDGFGRIEEARHLSWYYLAGGFLGAAYVTTALVAVRALGAGAVVAAAIAGQLTMSVVIDQLGLLGVSRQPLTAAKAAGVALLIAGTYLVVRE